MTNKIFFRSLLVFLCILNFSVAQSQSGLTVDQIPNPQTTSNTYVSDAGNILTPAETDTLNNILSGMRSKTGVQAAIAIVQNFSPEGDDFDFATKLFRKWGIGGAKSSNGLLLFVAIDAHKYRFITGYGAEGLLPDALLGRIGDNYLVPAFKQEQYGAGIIKAISIINDYLNQPQNQKDLEALLAKDKVDKKPTWYQPVGEAALLIIVFVFLWKYLKKETPEVIRAAKNKIENGYDKAIKYITVGFFLGCFALVFVFAFTIGFEWMKFITLNNLPVIVYCFIAVALAMRYMYVLAVIRKIHTDDQNYSKDAYAFQKRSCWLILFSPPILILIVIAARWRIKAKKRFVAHTDDKGNPMTRVDRDINIDGKPFLSAGQRAEEKQDVYSYDIWVGKTDTDFKIIQNEDSNFDNFTVCTKCGFKTMSKPQTVTIIKPTYSMQGQGKEVCICAFCKREELIKLVILPMLSNSSSSSSSSSSSGSDSSSSSSSSGSFGGGSTGGGGAGGSW